MLQIFASVIPQVIEPTGRSLWVINRWPSKTSYNASDDIVDVGKVAPHLPIIEKLDWLAFENRFREDPSGHVGSTPGSVNGEEPQSRDGQSEKMGIAICHQFIRPLRRGIERFRRIDGVGLGERNPRVS